MTRELPARATKGGTKWHKGRTIEMKLLTSSERAIGALLYPERGFWRPATRADCSNVQRPCPYVGCRHNLYMDAKPGSTSLQFYDPNLEPWEILSGSSCSLDLADRGRMALEDVGAVLGLTRERVRQIEAAALVRMLEQMPPGSHDALRALAASGDATSGDAL